MPAIAVLRAVPIRVAFAATKSAVVPTPISPPTTSIAASAIGLKKAVWNVFEFSSNPVVMAAKTTSTDPSESITFKMPVAMSFKKIKTSESRRFIHILSIEAFSLFVAASLLSVYVE